MSKNQKVSFRPFSPFRSEAIFAHLFEQYLAGLPSPFDSTNFGQPSRAHFTFAGLWFLRSANVRCLMKSQCVSNLKALHSHLKLNRFTMRRANSLGSRSDSRAGLSRGDKPCLMSSWRVLPLIQPAHTATIDHRPL